MKTRVVNVKGCHNLRHSLIRTDNSCIAAAKAHEVSSGHVLVLALMNVRLTSFDDKITI